MRCVIDEANNSKAAEGSRLITCKHVRSINRVVHSLSVRRARGHSRAALSQVVPLPGGTTRICPVLPVLSSRIQSYPVIDHYAEKDLRRMSLALCAVNEQKQLNWPSFREIAMGYSRDFSAIVGVAPAILRDYWRAAHRAGVLNQSRIRHFAWHFAFGDIEPGSAGSKKTGASSGSARQMLRSR